MLDGLTTALATAAAKALAGLTIASASVGGLVAADVVELPLPAQDKPAEVTTEDKGETPELPDGAATRGQDAAEAKGANAEESRQDGERGEDDAENEDTDVDAADPEANNFGQDVADLAQDPASTGADISAFARSENPGADHRAGAPATAGERQDDTEDRQDTETDAAAENRRDADAPHGAEAAEQDTSEPAGSAATGEENRGGAAAAGARD